MNNPQSGFLGARGVEFRAAKVPFWKPDPKKATYVILEDVRAPAPHEAQRVIKDQDTGEERILTFVLFADVKHEGIAKRWEMTSVRCAQALNRLPPDTKLPAWIRVAVVGKGKDTDFDVRVENPPETQRRLTGNVVSDDDLPHDEKDAIARR